MTQPTIKEKIPYFISVGEASGDLLAAELVSALEKIAPEYQAYGITGDAMRKAGVVSLADSSTLSIMGFVEVIKRLPALKRFEKNVLQKLSIIKPRFAILVDSPGFHFHLAKKLKRGSFKSSDMKVIQYVAPQLWAWHESRVIKLKRDFDLVLGILPFEDQFFKSRDVNYHYVGTPHLERVKSARNIRADLVSQHATYAREFNIGSVSDKTHYGFFPGSRVGEFVKLMPVILETASYLDNENTPFLGTISLSSANSKSLSLISKNLTGMMISEDKRCLKLKNGSQLLFTDASSRDIMRSVDAAIVKSGTGTLECALIETPFAVVYRTNALNFLLAKHLVKTPYICLANLIANKLIVKEYIQNIVAKALAEELTSLGKDGDRRREMIRDFGTLKSLLLSDAPHRAAKIIRDFCRF